MNQENSSHLPLNKSSYDFEKYNFNNNRNLALIENSYKEKNVASINTDNNNRCIDIKAYFEEDRQTSVNPTKMLLLSLNASLGFFFIGYHLTSLNVLEYYIPLALSWTFEEKTDLFTKCSCMVPLGALLGSIVSGKISSMNLGRKNSIILFNFIGIIGSFITIIPDTYIFIVGRFIVGIVTGAFSTLIPLYIKEFIPLKKSGKYGMIYFLFYDIGVLTAFLLGLFLPNLGEIKDFYDKNTYSRYNDSSINGFWWRFIMLFPCLMNILNILFFKNFFDNDTPEFLISQKRDYKNAEHSLSLIYEDQTEIQQIVKKIKSFHESTLSENRLKYRDLFSKKYRLRLIIGIIINIGQQATAIKVYLFYSQLIYLKKEPLLEPSIYSFYFSIAEILGTTLAIFIIEKMGRRKLLLTGLFWNCICLFLISFFYFINIFTWHKFIVIIYYFLAGISVDPLVWIINANLLPDIGIGICATANWIATIVIIICFPFMMESFLNLEGTFLIFTILTFLLLIFVFLFFKETRNKTHKELTLLYSKWF